MDVLVFYYTVVLLATWVKYTCTHTRIHTHTHIHCNIYIGIITIVLFLLRILLLLSPLQPPPRSLSAPSRTFRVCVCGDDGHTVMFSITILFFFVFIYLDVICTRFPPSCIDVLLFESIYFKIK